MLSIVCSAVSSRTLRVSSLTLLLLVSGAFVANVSAQVQYNSALLSLTSLRLPVPTASSPIASYAHPVARLIGTTEHIDLPRPFRSRVILIDTIRTTTPATRTPVTPNFAPATVSGLNATSQEQRMMQLINAERSKLGLRPLMLDTLLLKVARGHSENMATKDFFNHVSPDGKTASERAKCQGLKGWKALGENIAYNQGYDDPIAFAVEQWLKSPLHRENMLNPMWSSTAVGIATAADGRIFFTELFLAR